MLVLTGTIRSQGIRGPSVTVDQCYLVLLDQQSSEKLQIRIVSVKNTCLIQDSMELQN